MTSKPSINTPPTNSDDWAHEVQKSLGLEADKQTESSVEPVTNTTANLSNPITKSNDTADSSAGTPDIDTAMPGGFVGGIASAGTGVSLKDASNQAKDAATRAYEAAATKVGDYTDGISKSANESAPNNLHEIAEKLKVDEKDPSNAVKDLADSTKPGVAGEYGHKAAAAVAGVAGAAGITGAAAAGVAASKKEEWKPKNYGDHVLSNPMDFPAGTFPTLETLAKDPESIPYIPSVSKERVEKASQEKKDDLNKQEESNKATKALAGVTAGVGGAGATSALIADKYAPKTEKVAENTESSTVDNAQTIATNKTAHGVSPPDSSANIVKNSQDPKVTPKRSFSQRFKGDMKILFGKLSKNDTKISEGRELKNGK